MPTNRPIQVVKLRFKPDGNGGFCAIQVVLSNGIESPVFVAKGSTADNMIDAPINANIERITGATKNSQVREIVFKDKNGKQLSEMYSFDFYRSAAGQMLTTDQDLKQGEQIIGVHGFKGTNNCINTLGFIVWTPPKF